MPQTDVQYDGIESSGIDYPSSGSSLLWNLNKIRGWLAPAKWLMGRAQDPEAMTLYVEPGVYFTTSGSPHFWMGGSSGSFSVPTSGSRIDVLYMDGATDSLVIKEGSESGSPVPSYPTSGSPFTICEVYLRPSGGSIFNLDTAGQHYIYRDIRPFLNLGGGGGGGATDHGDLTGLDDPDDHTWALKKADFTAKGDLLAGTGSETFQALGVGDDGQYLKSDSGQTTGLIWSGAGGGQDTYLIGWTFHGTLTTGTGLGEAIRPPSSGSVMRAIAVVKNAGTSGSTIVDINKSGTTIFTDQSKRLMVQPGGDDYDSSIPDVRMFSQYDKFTPDIDSTADGALTMWVALLMQQGTVGGAGSLAGGVYSVTAESPTASEDICIGFTFCDITIEEIQAVVKGSSPSITIDPYHTQDRSGGGTNNDILASATAITNTAGGQNLTSFDDDTIPADSWIILKTTAKSGTVGELVVTIRYTVD
jgi:hypothetical protein